MWRVTLEVKVVWNGTSILDSRTLLQHSDEKGRDITAA
jgi:hypothetical protein